MPSIFIFGYGSLVHRPGFEHARRVVGYIPGFKRVWHQGSTDHRGTPDAPGRVVTLEPCPGHITWGVAYELPGSHERQLETLRYLEWREKQYDERHLVNVYGDPDQDVWAHLRGTTPTSNATAPTDSRGSAPPAAIPHAISCPEALDQHQGGDAASRQQQRSPSPSPSPQPVAFDPLMSSEEVLAYKPPSDWQRLSAKVWLDGEDADGTDADGDGDAPPHLPGTPAGTRLLLRGCLCYIASSDTSRNTNYMGPAPLSEIAEQIAGAVGPSGPNWEYCVKLADAMRQIGVEDAELFKLEALVLQLREAQATAVPPRLT